MFKNFGWNTVHIYPTTVPPNSRPNSAVHDVRPCARTASRTGIRPTRLTTHCNRTLFKLKFTSRVRPVANLSVRIIKKDTLIARWSPPVSDDEDEDEEDEDLDELDDTQSRFPAKFRPMRMCWWFTFGNCPQGWGCMFGHSVSELHPPSSWSRALTTSTASFPRPFVLDRLWFPGELCVWWGGRGGGERRGYVLLSASLLV